MSTENPSGAVSRVRNGIGARWTYTRRGYALAQSLRHMKRYKLATTGTLLVLGITLSLPFILYFSSATLVNLSERSVQGESLTAYLNERLSDLEGAELASGWQRQTNILETQYISREQALAMLGEQTDISEAIDVLGVNPLPGAIVVYPQTEGISAASIGALARSLEDQPEVARVQLDLRWVKRLQAAVGLFALIGSLLALFLTLTALLVIFNTLRLELSRRRKELEIARLLGATNSFMNRPLMYTGALFGVLGGVVGCTIALLALNAIRAPADDLSSLYNSTFVMQMPNLQQVLTVIGVSLVMGIAGAISSLYRSSQHLTHNS